MILEFEKIIYPGNYNCFMGFRGNCTATGIGSLPHAFTSEALKLIKENFREIPYWPQMKKYGGDFCFKEGIDVQFVGGFPGIVIDEKKKKIYFDAKKFSNEKSQYSKALLSEKVWKKKILPKYAHGLRDFMRYRFKKIRAVKGQITGPITFGFGINDSETKGPIFQMEELEMPKLIMRHLRNVFIWQEKLLRKKHGQTIIFFDEPSINQMNDAPSILEEFFELIKKCKKGFVGLHCCDNYDWEKLLNLKIDVISFDAYQYAVNFCAYTKDIKNFIDSGRIIAWGIVPAHNEDLIKNETADSLLERLEENAFKPLRNKVSEEFLITVLKQSLITPSCGLGTHEVSIAKRAVKLTREVSEKLKEKYELP